MKRPKPVVDSMVASAPDSVSGSEDDGSVEKGCSDVASTSCDPQQSEASVSSRLQCSGSRNLFLGCGEECKTTEREERRFSTLVGKKWRRALQNSRDALLLISLQSP